MFFFAACHEIFSTSWFLGTILQNVCANVCSFVYVLRLFCMFVYGFCGPIRLLRTFVYGFCARCAAFAYVYGSSVGQVVRILCTYADFLCELSGFTYVYGLSFAMFDADRLEGSDLAGYLIYYCLCELSWFIESIDDPILRVVWFAIVRANACDLLKFSIIWSWWFRRFLFPCRAICYDWTVSRILSLWFRQVIFPRAMFVMIGVSQGSDI